jgi:orotate phosphoribosyltransferase
VVPSGQGRPGAHPLAGLVRSSVALPVVRLSVVPREIHTRGVNPAWVRVGDPVAGADVLVVDDTWVSGGSAQSTAAALKLAGARRVAVVVLGRHVNPADPRSAVFLAAAKNSPQAVPWDAAASSWRQ